MHECFVGLRSNAPINPGESLGVKHVIRAGDDNADELGPLADEAAGGGIGAVTELAGRRQNGLARFLTNARGIVHHQRDEGLGHAGAFGYVAYRRLSHS